MLLNVDDLVSMSEFNKVDVNQLQSKVDALEIMIRKMTNNNFQNRNVRFTAQTNTNSRIMNVHPFLKVGDTVQISESGVNDGVYTITDIQKDFIRLDRDLFTTEHNLVTKVEYPKDVILGCLNLLKWDIQNRDKVGVKSETLSRHSVTYFDMDANHENGYPSSLLGFLKPYKKARF